MLIWSMYPLRETRADITPAGSLLSQAHDTTRNIPDYNNIVVNNTTPSGTTVITWVRAADTQANLSTATWYTAVSQLPDKRWVQWRINLTGNTYLTPTINEVNLTWIYDNEDPISAVTSLTPYWQNDNTIPDFSHCIRQRDRNKRSSVVL